MAYKSIDRDDVIVCTQDADGKYYAVLLHDGIPLWHIAGFNTLHGCETFKASCYRAGDINLDYWCECELFDVA